MVDQPVEREMNGVPYVQGGDPVGGTDRKFHPLKAGAEYNSTLPTFADGEVSVLQTDDSGRLTNVGSNRVTQEQNVALTNRQVATWADSAPINGAVVTTPSAWIDLATYAGGMLMLKLDHGTTAGYGTFDIYGSHDNGTTVTTRPLYTLTTTPGVATEYETYIEINHQNFPRYIRINFTLGAATCTAYAYLHQKTSY